MSNSAQLLFHKALMPQAWNGPHCVKQINLLMTYGRKTTSINPNNVSVENGSNKFYHLWVFSINIRNNDIINCLRKGIILGYKHFFF